MAAPAHDGFLGLRLDLASRAAALSFVSNVTLMVLKITVGVLTGSVAVLSDGIDSAQDAIASTFAFVSIRLANQPADEEHPYGHGKAEAIAAMGQSLLIGGGATYIMVRAVSRLIDRDVEIDTGPGMIALAATALVNVLVVMYVGYAARTTGSVALKADTRHLWTNVFQAAAVIAALALVAVTGNSVFDPIVALGLAVYLLWTAAGIFMSGMTEMMDVRLPVDERELIEHCLSERTGRAVRGYHGLRTRKAGRERYVDVHVQIDAHKTVAEAHDISEELEAAIRERLPGVIVTVHMEPHEGV
ncbi:MAG: cation diffusion facilitator family transporter [Dehalococcoidia bacterium]